MLTREQVLEAVKSESRKEHRVACDLLDGQDYFRLVHYFPVEQWGQFGVQLVEGKTPSPTKDWTEENITASLKEDLEFAVEKAENQRGISSELMYEVVKQWLWILEDDLGNNMEYSNYGLPFLLKVKEQYFPND